MESTITRTKLLSLIQEMGQAGSAQLVEDVMDGLGYGGRQEFTKAEFMLVMQGVTDFARRSLAEPGAFGDVSPEESMHVRGMLDALDQHVFPLIRAKS